MGRKSTYYFNYVRAKQDALESVGDDMFFYNGEYVEDMPVNCVNVKIENLYDYFSVTTYPLISEINFDLTNLSDEIKSEIINNFSQTIELIKNQNVEVINDLLNREVTLSTLNVMIYSFFKYILQNDDINDSILYKVTNIIGYINKNNITISDEVVLNATRDILVRYKANSTFLEIHLNACASAILSDFSSVYENYFALLSATRDIVNFTKYFKLVYAFYPIEKFELYIKHFSKHLFNENFFEYDILEQKIRIYKLYYISNINYPRGQEYIQIYNVLKPVFLKAIENKLDELAFFLCTPLQMSHNGVVQTHNELKIYNQEIEKPLELFIAEHMIKKYKLKPNSRVINKNKTIKIVFLQERIINYSIFKVLYSLLNSLNKPGFKNFEFIIYDLSFPEFGGSDEQTVTKLKNLGIKYVNLDREFSPETSVFVPIVKKALYIRKKIIKDKVDVLIGMHSRPEYNFLFTTRTAPLQVYWSHGNFEYSIENIDRYISHYQHCDSSYPFHSFIIPRTEESFNPPVNETELNRVRALYPEKTTILGSIGRLTKMESKDYLMCVGELLHKYSNTIFLACGSGDNTKIKDILKELNVPMNRFIFTGHIDAHIYGNIIDILLNTFPHEQGEAVAEFMAKSKPVVSLKPTIQLEHECNDMYNSIRKCPIVNNTKEYVEVASMLIENKNYREKVGQCNKDYMNKKLYTKETNFIDSLGF